MAAFRLVLVLAILVGLCVFALQNWSPLQLVFLGVKTQALPLAIWILVAVAVGFLTSWAVAWLLELYDYLSVGKLRSRIRQLEAEKANSQWQRRDSQSASGGSYSYSSTNTTSDSKQQSSKNDDWRDREDISNVTDRSYEVKQEPTSSSRSGSVYSYSYKNPSDSGVGKTESVYNADSNKNPSDSGVGKTESVYNADSYKNPPSDSGVGKRESVYDADYRVITPPYRDPYTQKTDNEWESNKKSADDEDWGFDDDDDFDDDDLDNPSRRR